MIVSVVLCSVIFLGLGYFLYGKWLGKKVELDPKRPTPAQTMADGKDFVPASPFLLLGQHFSAIAAAGPIVGPILAGLWFGWVPALLWILLGSVFVGGPHDFLSLVASIRHKASSIGSLAKTYLSKRIERLFLIFIWFTLIYVIIAFTDITAQSFKAVSGDMVFGPAVVFSSLLYLVLGLVLGIILRFTKIPLTLATLLFLPLVFLVIWWGTKLPPSVTEFLSKVPIKGWEAGLLFYCFIASIIPVWLLLQPDIWVDGFCTAPWQWLFWGLYLADFLFNILPFIWKAFAVH
jgi:carbon starvation protein